MDYDDLPKTRAEAISLSVTRYFTGKPCKNGHISPRAVGGAHCVACDHVRGAKYRAENADKIAHYQKERLKDPAKKAEHAALTKAWRENNIDEAKAYQKQWYQQNKDRKRPMQREWQRNNPEKCKAYYAKWWQNGGADVKKEWKKANKGKVAAYSNNRRIKELKATPPWLTDQQWDAIYAKYNEAQRMTDETGIDHEVDHIVPLQGKNVCGLHVAWNMQVITKKANRSKGNKFVEQASLSA